MKLQEIREGLIEEQTGEHYVIGFRWEQRREILILICLVDLVFIFVLHELVVAFLLPALILFFPLLQVLFVVLAVADELSKTFNGNHHVDE